MVNLLANHITLNSFKTKIKAGKASMVTLALYISEFNTVGVKQHVPCTFKEESIKSQSVTLGERDFKWHLQEVDCFIE